ncbi:mobile mystery protein A [Microbaculum marinum]|uniref:Mobile mystery protein A n=1 Tax=Microbaculum marinum TaxID=1764581 RepID=A0AAW9RUD7_9HYPH
MSVKQTALRQYRKLVDTAARQVSGLSVPAEGWIATVRRSLAMSGAQLGRRAGLSRARISQVEQAELSGGTTLRTMHALAAAMGCRFVYAIVPDGGANPTVEDLIAAQARRKAHALVETTSKHMALEKQGLPPDALRQEIERIADEMVRDMPPDFWEYP